MSKGSILIIFSLALFFSGCFESGKNRNARITANINNSNKPSDNTNTNESNENSNTKAEEDVVEFDNAEDALAKGNEYFDANKTRLAIKAYKQAINFDKDLAEAHFKMGVMYSLIEKEKNEAPPAEDTKKSKKPKKPASEKHFENAVKAYKKIVAKNRKDDVAYFDLGRAYNKLYNDVEAEKAFRKAAKLKPDNGTYQTELGAALIKLAKYGHAIKALNKAKEIDEFNVRAEDLLIEAKSGKKRVNFKKKGKK